MKSSEENFKQIIIAAEKRDRQYLRALHDSGYSVNQRFCLETPAAYLAAAGKFDEVEFLKEHGALITFIAEGAARGGYLDYVRNVMLSCGSQNG